MFNKKSDLLPEGLFNSQNTYLVFNSEKDSEYKHYDRIEIRIQKNRIYIGHNSIISIDINFEEFMSCNSCSDKLTWAHIHNKNLIKDILSSEVQELIGII